MVVTPPPAHAWEMRGAKQPREKYLMTNKHKSEYGKVWWITVLQQQTFAIFVAKLFRHSGVAGPLAARGGGQICRPFVLSFLTARCYASPVLAMALCLSVRLSVCLSQSRCCTKRLNVGSHKQHHTIAQGVNFSETKDLREIPPGSPATRAPNAGGVDQNRRLVTNSRLYLENGTRQTHGFY